MKKFPKFRLYLYNGHANLVKSNLRKSKFEFDTLDSATLEAVANATAKNKQVVIIKVLSTTKDEIVDFINPSTTIKRL
ncbi:hypothetical protein HYO65_gp072 [Tenacibaculum phage PTm1]|uniref:Uncharacterized protein n=2 Tax=Shirahamavirus PTm1 TaxID=2846435 RepID=A0A5S9HXE2_9CAUD|nr:hypothetical protein HYO65_gp072 [Tenacibaculum phage PTm1]BBI90464.1 hypothetical protein [Tenacibaculum phage PTm1]BBI90772.1 hypothetical protein [Tenacibaculum phage PTm5]